jgi:abortive infection bacteriophage resistance protein
MRTWRVALFLGVVRRMYENVYRREAMSSAEVIEQLKQRGMSIPRLAEAEAVLERLNYYRLSAYWHQYLVLEEVDASFRPGTSFDDVIDHYDYDERLRELVWLRLEIIEVALRRSFACLLAQRYGPFPHLHPQLFANRDSWTKSHIGIQSDYRRANEEFVKHHSKTYPDLILPPIGAVVECSIFWSSSTFWR